MGKKETTRQRIIENAGRLFRRHGYNGVGIDDIMAAADLTRGGFYAHFASKQELFAATLGRELELTRRLRDSSEPDGQAFVGAAHALIEFYLDRRAGAPVSDICQLVALSADVARATPAAAAAYGAALRDLIAEIARRIPSDLQDADARALAAVALCVGGVVLAHAAGDDPLADRLRDVCRTRVLAELGGR